MTSFISYTVKVLSALTTGLVLMFFCATVVFALEPDVSPQPNPDTNAGAYSDFGDSGTVPTFTPTNPNNSNATNFVPLVAIPGFTDTTEQRSLADYLNIIFRVAIGLGALAAVIRITFAGIKYMSTDRFYSKEEAKKDITSSLFGLLIILSTVLVLAVIYPGILNLNILQKLTPLKTIPYQDISSTTIGDSIVVPVENVDETFALFTAACKSRGGEASIHEPGSLEYVAFAVIIATPIQWFMSDEKRFVEKRMVCTNPFITVEPPADLIDDVARAGKKIAFTVNTPDDAPSELIATIRKRCTDLNGSMTLREGTASCIVAKDQPLVAPGSSSSTDPL